jgi:hypothetical protein
MTIQPLTAQNIAAAKDLSADGSNAIAHFFYKFADENGDGTTTAEIDKLFEASALNTNGGTTLDELEQMKGVVMATLALAVVCEGSEGAVKAGCDDILHDAELAMDYLSKNSPLAQDPIAPITFGDIAQADKLDPDHKNIIAHSLYLSARSDPSKAPTGTEIFNVYQDANFVPDDQLSGVEQEQALKTEIKGLDLILMFTDPQLLEGNQKLKDFVTEHQSEIDAARAEKELCIEALEKIDTLRTEHLKKYTPKPPIKSTRI